MLGCILSSGEGCRVEVGRLKAVWTSNLIPSQLQQ